MKKFLFKLNFLFYQNKIMIKFISSLTDIDCGEYRYSLILKLDISGLSTVLSSLQSRVKTFGNKSSPANTDKSPKDKVLKEMLPSAKQNGNEDLPTNGLAPKSNVNKTNENSSNISRNAQTNGYSQKENVPLKEPVLHKVPVIQNKQTLQNDSTSTKKPLSLKEPDSQREPNSQKDISKINVVPQTGPEAVKESKSLENPAVKARQETPQLPTPKPVTPSPPPAPPLPLGSIIAPAASRATKKPTLSILRRDATFDMDDGEGSSVLEPVITIVESPSSKSRTETPRQTSLNSDDGQDGSPVTPDKKKKIEFFLGRGPPPAVEKSRALVEVETLPPPPTPASLPQLKRSDSIKRQEFVMKQFNPVMSQLKKETASRQAALDKTVEISLESPTIAPGKESFLGLGPKARVKMKQNDFIPQFKQNCDNGLNEIIVSVK